MNRSIGLERTYWLGDFRNLKVSDYISDIPEDVMLNTEAMSLLRQLQVHAVDLVYLKYIKDSITVRRDPVHNANRETIEEYISEVQKSRTDTFESLVEAFASKNTPEKEMEEEVNVTTTRS